jgi:choloylglycine hydrolase
MGYRVWAGVSGKPPSASANSKKLDQILFNEKGKNMKIYSRRIGGPGSRMLTAMRAVVPLGIIAVTIVFCLDKAPACTDFYMTNAGEHRISARTMDMNSGASIYDTWALVVYPRNQPHQSKAPQGRSGLKWTSKYSFVGVTPLVGDSLAFPHDGLNEKGLGVALNWLVGTQFGQPTADETALAVQDVALWMLGNFATCDELLEGLNKVTVWSDQPAETPFHLAIHDATGKSMVIEWVNREMKAYDNTMPGILTNEPQFTFYIEKIKYLQWQETLANPAIGVPAAWYPIDRFMRAYMVRKGLPAPKSYTDAITQAVHILNTIQTPWGAPGTDSAKPASIGNFDHTTWSVVRDHQNKILYFRTVTNQQLHAVDLKKLDLTRSSVLSLEIDKSDPQLAIDVTTAFSTQKPSAAEKK